MKKQWLIAVAAISILAIGLVGCKKENAGIETEVQEAEDREAIEEAQNKIIAEYAANVLMKYNSGSNHRVLDGQKLLVEEGKEDAAKAQEERRQQLQEEYQKNEKEEQKQETTSSVASDSTFASESMESAPEIQYISDMASVMSLPSFSIVYNGYEVADSYQEDLISFTVDAKAGKVLLITKFTVTNTSDQEEELNVLALAPEFKLSVGNRNIKAQQTMLLNDLSMYKEKIPAGESKEAVLIFEVGQEVAAASDNMELILNINDQAGRMQLEQLTVIAPEEVSEEPVVEGEEVMEPEVAE
ncbi:MAG: hypothetical protein IKW28_09155 [Lachnospiraceae bacterium]|nr:hypothetical protein [Lachnospiraceae bacterium]